jgi:hypothetical protein
MATASWRKDFKFEWKKVMSRVNNSEISTLRYHTDPIRGVCACPSLQLRFLFCKHILTCYEPIRDPVDFFRNIRRMRCSPFWVHPQLVLSAEHQRQVDVLDDALTFHPESLDLEDDGKLEETEETEEDIDPAAISEDQLLDLDDDFEDHLSRFESDLQRALDIFRDQRAKGNSKFLDSFMSTCAKTQDLVQEITARQNQQTMPRTWGAWKYIATIYHQ